MKNKQDNSTKNKNNYKFECMLHPLYANETCLDEWGVACLFNESETQGVEYNFCVDGGKNLSAIYKMEYSESTDYMVTDPNQFVHYEIDFSSPNWEKELKDAMINAFEHFFPPMSQQSVPHSPSI